MSLFSLDMLLSSIYFCGQRNSGNSTWVRCRQEGHSWRMLVEVSHFDGNTKELLTGQMRIWLWHW